VGVCLIEFGFDGSDYCWRISMEPTHMVEGIVELFQGLVMGAFQEESLSHGSVLFQACLTYKDPQCRPSRGTAHLNKPFHYKTGI
jgi:hypothetical protein